MPTIAALDFSLASFCAQPPIMAVRVLEPFGRRDGLQIGFQEV
jgi:hypothetical protein